MDMFDDRQKAFEKKFSMSEELKFKLQAKTVKRLGMWAAEKMGYVNENVLDYANKLVLLDIEHPGIDDVLDKLVSDFQAKNLAFAKEDIVEEYFRIQEKLVAEDTNSNQGK